MAFQRGLLRQVAAGVLGVSGVLAAPLGWAQQAAPSPLAGKEIYVGAGFQGLALGLSVPVTAQTGFRVEVSGFPFDLTETRDGTPRSATNPDDLNIDDFSAKINGSYQRLSLLGDYFPWQSSGFRLTGGVQFNRQSASGGASILASNATRYYTYEGRDYRVDLDRTSASGDVSFPRVTPYVGVGWGHQVRGTGLSFYADLGLSIGRHTAHADPVNLQFSVYDAVTGAKIDNAQTQAKQAEVLAAANQTVQDERNRFQRMLDRFFAWPQVAVGVSYRF